MPQTVNSVARFRVVEMSELTAFERTIGFVANLCEIVVVIENPVKVTVRSLAVTNLVHEPYYGGREDVTVLVFPSD